MSRPRTPPGPQSRLPSREDLVAFIGTHAGKIGTREVARAFGLKNADRAALRVMLRALEDEGLVERRRKRLHRPGELPSVVLADVVERDPDGELIAVPAEWDEEAHGAAPKIRIHLPRRAHPAETGGIGDRALLRVTPEVDDGQVTHTGRIIKILDRAKHRVLGVFRALPNGGGRLAPIDKRRLGQEVVIAPGATGDAADGDLVAVDVTRPPRFGPAVGRVKERLGSLKSERAVSLIAIETHGIPHEFPRTALDEAVAATPASLGQREDWRHVPLITIDPADAKDHDDAVHAEPDTDPANPGGHVVTVAIADVAHYVRPQSAMDREALRRGNSVYFPDRVVPMLPERIANDLCSLKPNEDRAAMAVRMVIGADGRKKRHTFHRVIVRSAAKLDYVQAQRAVDGQPDAAADTLRERVIAPLFVAYEALKRAREDRAPLDLDLPERKILLAPDGSVERIVTPERLESHRLIEEFMILANVAAAETLESARLPFIYRVHDSPTLEKVEALREFLATLGISLPKGQVMRAENFNRILARARGSETQTLVSEIVLRTQAQAEYAATNYGHFGLNLRRYAHFTSPIRRYADLVMHRALIRALKLGHDGLPENLDVAALSEISAQISTTERRALAAERETADRLIAHHLADRIGATFEGRISGVVRAGLFVRLDASGADGFVPAATIGADYYRHDEAAHALVGDATGETYRLGDPVSVRLVEAAPVAGALRFEILSEGRQGAARGRHRTAGRATAARPKPSSRSRVKRKSRR